VDKQRGVVGLYMNPQEQAAVFSIDENEMKTKRQPTLLAIQYNTVLFRHRIA